MVWTLRSFTDDWNLTYLMLLICWNREAVVSSKSSGIPHSLRKVVAVLFTQEAVRSSSVMMRKHSREMGELQLLIACLQTSAFDLKIMLRSALTPRRQTWISSQDAHLVMKYWKGEQRLACAVVTWDPNPSLSECLSLSPPARVFTAIQAWSPCPSFSGDIHTPLGQLVTIVDFPAFLVLWNPLLAPPFLL